MFDPGVDVDDFFGIIGDLGVAQPDTPLHHKPRKDTINTADVITAKWKTKQIHPRPPAVHRPHRIQYPPCRCNTGPIPKG